VILFRSVRSVLVLFAYTASFHFFLKTDRVVVASATITTKPQRISPEPHCPPTYYKPPILAYTKQTLSSITTVSTRRSTRGQTAPSVSSLNDNATVPLHRIHPDIPPAVESTQITPSTPSTLSSLTPSLTPSSTHQSDPGSPPGLAIPPAEQSTAITPSTPSTPSSLAPSSPHQSDPGTPPGLVSCSNSNSNQSFYNTRTS
jgi:hypothetical protein